MGLLDGLRKSRKSIIRDKVEEARALLEKMAEDRPKSLIHNLPEFYGVWGEPKEENLLEFLNIAMQDAHVRMCVDAIASAIIANGFTVQSSEPEVKSIVEEYIMKREDELIDLVKRMSTSLAIFDECYLEAHENIGFPRIIAPWTITVQRDNYGRILSYKQMVVTRIDLSPEEVVHIRANAWIDFAYAVPKIKTLYRTLMVKREAEIFYYNVLMRKGVMAKFFNYRGGDAATFEALRQELTTTKPGTTIIAMGDWEVRDLGSPIDELKLPDIIENCIQTIISIFGVPRILLGYTEAATLETSRNQIVVFQQRIRDLQNLISAGITEAFKRILRQDNFRIELLPWTNPEQQMRIAITKLQAGVISIDEARKELGLSEMNMDYTRIPIPPGTGQFVGLEVQEALARIQRMLEESRMAFPEKADIYPKWEEDLEYVKLLFVEPPRVDLSTIRYLTLDSYRGIELAIADVRGDEFGLIRRPVMLRFPRKMWTLEQAKRWYFSVFPSWVMKTAVGDS
ncbi:MAG: phage portal protein [Nitrososphaerota archaeon]